MQRGQLWCCDAFLSFIGISGGFGVLEPQIHHLCPFRPRKWPSQAPKTLRFKGRMANCEVQKPHVSGAIFACFGCKNDMF